MTTVENNTEEPKRSISFVEQLIEEDLAEGKNGGRIQTRFPPEPNGYLHIGHAKAICMDFGVAEHYNGVCNLRFDDTNPSKENNEYVENILQDISWLGFKWGNIYYASDYFERLWDFALWMIRNGHAYVDEQTAEQIAEQKGTPTEPGTASPYRDRPVEESLRLFEQMNSPEAEEGSMVLRAKIDMANPNMHFRDPIIYRIIKTPHHRTGTKWNCYPMYDFAHGQSDYFEGVTHSICTLEFVPHRPLYDLFIDYLKARPTTSPTTVRDRSSSTASTSPTPLCRSASSIRLSMSTWSADGTIPACRPYVACAVVATPRRASASLSTPSATRSLTPSTTCVICRLPLTQPRNTAVMYRLQFLTPPVRCLTRNTTVITRRSWRTQVQTLSALRIWPVC